MAKALLALSLVPAYLLAEVVCALGPGAAAYKTNDDQRPTPDTMQVAARVNAAAKLICSDHCPQIAIYRNATAANAMLVREAEQAKFVYSPRFLATVYGAYGDNGIAALIAHELGHALDDTLGAAWVNPKWTAEVRADSWAGCLLGRMKLNDAELAATVGALAKYPSPAHPAWAQRLPAIRAGFGRCGGSAAKLGKAR